MDDTLITLPQEILNLNLFLESFENLERKSRNSFTRKDKQEFDQVFELLNKAEESEVAVIKSRAPNFNLFSILNISRFEDRVHSPFVAALLNPNGSHGQGRLFFDLFIDRLYGPEHAKQASEIDIKIEHSTYGGIFDLFIRYKIDSRQRFIVIENKIYASDQRKQLERYYGVLRKSFLVSDNYLLIYLTPDGRKPTPYSIEEQLLFELSNSGNFRCLSYADDISSILERSLTKIEAPVVRETIHQYLTTIKSL